MNVAEHFRLTGEEARLMLREVSTATSRWQTAARKAGLDQAAIELMAPAFEHDQTKEARAIVGGLAERR